ncbi:Site-specific recombinase XerD [Flavobacterium fryxellicola]|uniref:Integrase n=1 Tax=Flavobacterium fryxellicola TaxID=249352 RepID=A0A167XXC6_9FLAO|nr:tyrosine-type recombinase/integrase [Flavobacterium fryxellicola]OAB28787.1 integrase [Flavobacterium fryxellicola]SHN61731.1 Site-specific recombinase XerD [Flavobacterium fryxellicola]
MESISLLLRAVHVSVHDLPMKLNYNTPKFYTGGIDISQWNRLSKTEQKEALSKEWYLYYSFRNPDTKKLVRRNNIKAGVNLLKTKEERLKCLEILKINLLHLLKKGFDPNKENTALINEVLNIEETDEPKVIVSAIDIAPQVIQTKTDITTVPILNEMTIREAFDFGLKIKAKVINKTSYSGLQGRINRFLNWMDLNNGSTYGISTLDKKTIINYLNLVLENTSARNRNNTRIDLSSLVQVLVDNEIIKDNIVTSINTLKSTPERNKTYSINQEIDLLKYLRENDEILLLFIQFISYNFLRPVEVCRLKVGDLDLEGKKLFVRAKNKAVKIKIIPQKLLDLLPDLSKMNPTDYLFCPTQIGGEWEAEENNRRDHFSKRFKTVKDQFKLGKDYGLYSFRHTSITNLYRELNKTLTPFETKSTLMQITGHQTMEALEKYLRDIDAALPEDYSHLLK